MTLRRRLADRMAAEYVPAEPEEITDPLAKGVADALARRGITEVPGRQTTADIEWAEYRARTRQVLDALRVPEPPAPKPEPEVQQSLPDQLRSMIGQQYGAESLPLNGPKLTEHVVRQLQNPGGRGAQADGQSASGSGAT